MDKLEVRTIFAAVFEKSVLDPLLEILGEPGKRPDLSLADSKKRSGLSEGAMRFWGTKGTVDYFKSKGFNATSVVSGFDFDGRVKTLDRAIFSRILADRTNKSHLDELKNELYSSSVSEKSKRDSSRFTRTVDSSLRHSRPDRESDPRLREDDRNSEPFDAVIVDLYVPDKNNFTESMDVGGQALIRAAVKNYKNVAVAFDKESIKDLAGELKANDNSTSLNFRKTHAQKAAKIIAERGRQESKLFLVC